jgi:predicted nucleic acid-binding protein
VKRYVAESGSDLVRSAMQEAGGWFICRVGFVETARAVALAAGDTYVKRFASEWPSFGVVEVDQRLVEDAAGFAATGDLRSLDALHLASVLLLPRRDLTVATWDRRLHLAVAAHDVPLLPEQLL